MDNNRRIKSQAINPQPRPQPETRQVSEKKEPDPTDPSNPDEKSSRFLFVLPRSTIGSKIAVAITGAGLAIFVLGHLLGNLQMFMGQDAVNDYAKMLKSMPLILTVLRSGLLLFLIAHVALTLRLRIINEEARPIQYAVQKPQRSTFASRTMWYSGLAILFFVLYHLMHFTLFTINPSYENLTDAQGRHDVYNMVVLGFQNPLIVITYVLAVSFLGLHLSHALASTFQTLTVSGTKSRPRFKQAAHWIAALIVVGYVSIPVSVLLGIIKKQS